MVEILNIMKLEEAQSIMTLQMKLTLEWTESRLLFNDLKRKHLLNVLTPSEFNKLWMPSLVFANTEHRTEANFGQSSTYVTIKIKNGMLILVKSCQILSNLVKSCQILSNLVKSCQILSIHSI